MCKGRDMGWFSIWIEERRGSWFVRYFVGFGFFLCSILGLGVLFV